MSNTSYLTPATFCGGKVPRHVGISRCELYNPYKMITKFTVSVSRARVDATTGQPGLYLIRCKADNVASGTRKSATLFIDPLTQGPTVQAGLPKLSNTILRRREWNLNQPGRSFDWSIDDATSTAAGAPAVTPYSNGLLEQQLYLSEDQIGSLLDTVEFQFNVA